MTQYSWATCPTAVEAQITQFREHVEAILTTNLIGLYLHGSLAMGCFNPDLSDIDLLVLMAQEMTVETKRRVAELLLHSSLAPRPFEISFLVKPDIHPFQHPLPYDFHYGESWRERYRNALTSGEWMRWNDVQRKDSDLAAHITVTLHRGITLFGEPIREAFPAVPPQYYRASIVGDYEEARDNRAKMPMYFILNACRVYAYLLDGNILSKDEGASWGLRMLPGGYHAVIRQALEIYRGNREDEPFHESALNAFTEYVDERIRLKKIHP